MVFLEKLIVSQQFKKFPAFDGTQKFRFITTFTTAPPPIPFLNHINPIHGL